MSNRKLSRCFQYRKLQNTGEVQHQTFHLHQWIASVFQVCRLTQKKLECLLFERQYSLNVMIIKPENSSYRYLVDMMP